MKLEDLPYHLPLWELYLWVLPYFVPLSYQIQGRGRQEKPSMIQALKVPSITMAMYSVACSACSLGFIQATLEPHLRDFHLSPLIVGSLFVVSGGTYGFSAPLWGMICDHKPPKAVTSIGAVLIIIGFAVLGPLPFLGFNKSIGSIIGGLVLHGLGLGSEVVSGFADAHKSALTAGFPDTIDTYGLVSGLWTSTFALGAFIGPTVAGILFDNIGFPWGTMFIIGIHLAVLAFLVVFFTFCQKTTLPEVEITEDDPLEAQPAQPSYGSIDDQRPGPGPSRRTRGPRLASRTRKYSEAVAGSMAKSISMVYPQFYSTSYANPPPSYAGGAMGGSAVDRFGADTDELLIVTED